MVVAAILIIGLLACKSLCCFGPRRHHRPTRSIYNNELEDEYEEDFDFLNSFENPYKPTVQNQVN